jgi:hypothetical protein
MKLAYIRYAHGQMTLVDRAGLEATACECYKVAHEPFNSLCQLRTTSATAAGGRDSIVASATSTDGRSCENRGRNAGIYVARP